MAFENFNNVVMCVSPGSFASMLKAGETKDATLGLTVGSVEDANVVLEMFKNVFSPFIPKICLWLDEKVCQNHPDKMQELLFVVYSTRYLYDHGKPVIYLLTNLAGSNDNAKNAVSSSLTGLGFVPDIREIETWHLSGVYQCRWYLHPDRFPQPAQELHAFYVDLLCRNFFVCRDIFVFSESEKMRAEIRKIIREAEESVATCYPPLNTLFRSYRLLTEQQERLSNENNQLQIDLANQKKYLAVLRNEKEMEKIIEFYHQQYEVLPLWYKRFGHIIKLITGKRKIRTSRNQK